MTGILPLPAKAGSAHIQSAGIPRQFQTVACVVGNVLNFTVYTYEITDGDFIEFVDDVLEDLKQNKEYFANNMKHMNEKDHSFCYWLMMFLAWSEVSTEEDCKNYYEAYEEK